MTISDVVIGKPIHNSNGSILFPYKKTEHEIKTLAIFEYGLSAVELNDYPSTGKIFDDFEKIKFYYPGATPFLCQHMEKNNDNPLFYSDLAEEIESHNLIKSEFVKAIFA